MPAVAFIVAGALGRELWQDTLRRLWRQGVLKPEHCAGALTGEGAVETGGTSPLDGLIERLSRCTQEARSVELCRILRALGTNERAEMLSPAQMRLLHAAGCAIGSHGLTHTSLTLACDPWQELRDSRTALAASLGSEPVTLSFPNGRYNSDLVSMAWAAGYTCVFTSDPHLNRVPRRPACSLLLGRIHIPAATLSDQRGRLRPELLAAHLFLRPAVEAGCSR
jgi:peptidoglycan/xylan/chitin deacetylase (PgdA/CDA1 family)